jgi:hypothetical protein
LLCNLETGGKIDQDAAYKQIKALWKQLKASRKQLGIEVEPPEVEDSPDLE